MREVIDLVGTGRRVRKSLFWSCVLLVGVAAYLIYQGQVDADAGLTDDAKLIWFCAVPMVLLAGRAAFCWACAWVVSFLVVTTRD